MSVAWQLFACLQGPTEAERLREVLLEAPESDATRYLAVALSLALLVVILLLVRRRKLREEHTPIWILVSVVITIVSLRFDLLRAVTRAIGAWTPSSTIFFLGEVFLVLVCLNYAVRLSRMSTQIKNLAQETAVLRARLEESDAKHGEDDSAAG